ncbi:MAG: sedoheptulose 7-phosphate cyclase [Endomicrobium sp.]|jgi:3-dehydroquinate synthase|nr:sedoheptulose 7-phosphate cyclase [Endomicrobium sp.]
MKIAKNILKISFEKRVDYSLIFCEDVFDETKNILNFDMGSKRFIIVDSFIADKYHDKIHKYLAKFTSNYKIIPVEAGELNKNIDTFLYIARELAEFDVDRRNEPIIVIGGGVLMDVGNFVASCYRRGVPHISIPTTLMGYVDASVGIKTGINLDRHKNRLGTFDSPQFVYLDRSFLKTLPKRHIINGTGEIVKIALIKNAKLFEYLESFGKNAIDSNFQNEESSYILNQSIIDIVEELEPNLFEDNLERCVDFGHTFSLPFEMIKESPLLHGEAVAVDIAYSACLALVRNHISENQLQRIFNLMQCLGLPCFHPNITSEILWESVQERINHRSGFQRIPLPQGLGKCIFANDVTKKEIDSSLNLLRNVMYH